MKEIEARAKEILKNVYRALGQKEEAQVIAEALNQTRLEAFKEGQLDRYDEAILGKIRLEEFNRGYEKGLEDGGKLYAVAKPRPSLRKTLRKLKENQ